MSKFVSCSDDKTIKIWDIDNLGNYQCINTIVDNEEIICAAFTPDGSKIISYSYYDTKIWDFYSGNCINTIKIICGSLRSRKTITFNSIENTIISALNGIKIFNIENGQCFNTIFDQRFILCLSFNPIKNIIVSYGSDSFIKIRDYKTGNYLNEIKINNDTIICISFSPDGNKIACGSLNNSMIIFDSNSGICLQTLEGHSKTVNCVVFSKDGSIIISGSDDSTIKIWNSVSGECIITLIGHNSKVNCITFNSEEDKIISCSDDSTIKIWDINTGICLQTLEDHTSSVNSVSFEPYKHGYLLK